MIYKTIVQNILTYGSEVWQILNRELNRILATEMDVLRRPAQKSRLERIKNETIKEIMGVKDDSYIIDVIEQKRLIWYEDTNRMSDKRLSELIMEWIPEERR